MDESLSVVPFVTARILIEQADDPRIEPFRAVRERDLVGREGRFIAEGEVVVRVLLERSPFLAQAILVSPTRAAALADVLARAPCPVYEAPQAVLEAVAGFPIHRGVLALGRRGTLASAEDLLARFGTRALVLVLVGLTNHDNVGAAFRNAAAFGADAVILDGETCDPLYRKAIRVSAGASLFVPFARAGEPLGLLEELSRAGFTCYALTPRGRTPVGSVVPAARAALLLGSEGPGLPAAVLARCETVSIPMAAGFDSLNVATAGAIALHRFAQL